MRIPRIFSDQLLELESESELDTSASHYVATVLRMDAGRELVIFNGQGGEYSGRLTKVSKKSVHFVLDKFIPENKQSPLISELAISVSRGERMDWLIQKATELGVTKITPIISERTEVKLSGERGEKKLNHWRQVIISACEQCQRNILPTLNPIISLSDYLGSTQHDLKLILHTNNNALNFNNIEKPRDVTFLVGPEGGFSETEFAICQQKSFLAWQLGPRILRTETAPIAALSLLQHRWGDI